MSSDRPVVAVLGPVSVRHGDGAVAGNTLGGRRGRVVLVALALAGRPLPAERLAAMVWASSDPPPTWPVALRGVIRSIRAAGSTIGLDGRDLIVTTPGGYGLAVGVTVDLEAANESVRAAERLIGEHRFAAAIVEAELATQVEGAALLPGEDLDWLAPHRQAIDGTRLRGFEVLVEAASRAGDHRRAVTAARRAVAAAPLDERAHRVLIRALDRAGDRAGAVSAYATCRARLAGELGTDPGPETVEAYLAALRDPAPAASTGRFPLERSSFVGRGPERDHLAALIRSPGLVCVTGRGGVGKSRLAQHVASTGAAFAGGRFWVPLAAVADDELVASSVAIALGARVGTEDPTATISRSLAPLGPAVVVLDGCEQVVDGVAALVSVLLADCPGLTILVTSQRSLDLPDERVVTVAPLPDPSLGDAATWAANDAVRLLLDRVRAAGSDLAFDPASAPSIAELCTRCGGLPLALELAASQLGDMSVDDLLDHLAQDPDGDDRLRAVIGRSHALLDDDEAAVFRRLAVFDEPVGLPLISPVVAGAKIAEVRVVRMLRELTARGLLTVDSSGPRWRYEQDDDVHRYALDRLHESGETAETFGRLADAVRAVLPGDARSAPAPFEQQVTQMLGSVRSLMRAAVLGSADGDDGLEIAFRLHRYWASTDVAEGRFWLRQLLAAHPDAAWTRFAMYAAGYLSYWSGDAEAAVRELGAAADLLRDDDSPYRARALIFLGGIADDLDRGPDAIRYVREAIDAAAPFGIDLRVSAAMGMGCVLAERADPEAARHAAAAIDLCRSGGSDEQLAATLPTAAMVCWQVGDLAGARAAIAEARPLHVEARRIARVVLLSTAAGVALADGDFDGAIDYGRLADQEATELGVERELPLIRAVLARARLAAGDLVGAADRAAAAVQSAAALAFEFPLAMCLETAALVIVAAGSQTTRPDAADPVGVLLSTAGRLRDRGHRPGPPTLRTGVDEARARHPTGPPLTSAAAVAVALGALGPLRPG